MGSVPIQYRVSLAFLVAASLSAQTPSAYNAFVTGSGYTAVPRIAVAPGQIATFFVAGLPQTPAGLATLAASVNIEGSIQGAAILSAKSVDQSTLALTVQIPFDLIPSSVFPGQPLLVPDVQYSIQFGETSNPAAGICSQNACTPPISLGQFFAFPHIVSTCDIFYGDATSNCQPAITHQNGQFVTAGAPASPGEIVTLWALGLGAPAGGIPTGTSGPISMNDITLSASFTTVSAQGTSSGGNQTPITYQFAGLPSPSIGLYQINFAIPQPPANLGACGTSSIGFVNNTYGNLSIGVGRTIQQSNFSSGVTGFGGDICVSAH